MRRGARAALIGLIGITAGLSASTGGAAAAQAPAAPDSAQVLLQATRPALEQLAQQLDRAAQAKDSSGDARDWARTQAAVVRQRLAEGDFQIGDRVALRVEDDAIVAPLADRVQQAQQAQAAGRTIEQQLSDTFAVGQGRDLTLPAIGTVSLRGVLRSELEGHLTRYIGQYVRDPVVHARPLLRLSILGAVARPGYYYVPTDAVLPDAMMAAGGPKPEAKMSKARIERGGTRVWEGERLQRALAEGRTVDALNLRAGDQVVVPAASNLFDGVRFVSILLGIPVTVYALTRIH